MTAFLPGYRNRIMLTIDQTKVNAALTNFPVLIYLSNSSGISNMDVTRIFTDLGTNSLKIAVTTIDGVSQCYVEVEYWNSAGNEAWLWAKAPSVSDSLNTILWLYWDKTAPNNTNFIGGINTTPAENVWDANFMMVHHLDGAAATDLDDSTTNDNDVTGIADLDPSYNQDTIVGRGIDNERGGVGTEDGLDIDPNDALGGFSEATWEFWFNAESLPADGGAWQAILSKWDTTGTSRGWVFAFYGGSGETPATLQLRVMQSINGTGFNVTFYTWRPNTAQWYHVQVSWLNDGTILLYIDGVNTAWTSESSPASDMFNNTGVITRIGYHYTAGRAWDGLLDEIRVSDTKRLDGYMVANYNSQVDSLITYGPIEIRPNNIDYTLGTKNKLKFNYALKLKQSLESVITLKSITGNPRNKVQLRGKTINTH